MAAERLAVVFILWIIAVSNCEIAEEFQSKQTKVYAEEGCGPNRYALFCRNSFYDMTVANPNTEYVSSVKMRQLYDFLSHSKCYRHIKNFLCGALFPMCTDDPFEITFPCRDVCETAEAKCQPVLEKYGEVWPEELNCSRFYTTNCLRMKGVMQPAQVPPAKKNKHERTEGSKPAKKHNRNKNTDAHVRQEPEPEPEPELEPEQDYEPHYYDYGEEVHAETEAERKRMEEFWIMFKKTLSDVARKLKSLADVLY